MKTKIQFRRLALTSLALCFFCLNCASEEDAVEPSFIPPLTTQWVNVADTRNIFVFTKFSQTNEGFFQGTETTPSVSAVPYSFVGTYTNRNIEFIYLPGGGPYHTGKSGKYVGKIVGDGPGYTMELTSTTLGNLTLRRGS